MKEITEKQRIANNLALYIKINSYTITTFAKATNLSQNTISALITGKIRDGKKFHKYINDVTKKLNLEENYFIRDQNEITSEPIKFQDRSKMHIGDDKFNMISLMLKIGEIHYK